MLGVEQACIGQADSGDRLVGAGQAACGEALLGGGCIMDDQVGRLRGGGPEANSSGQEEPPDKESLSQNAEGVGEKEGNGDADSPDPMDQDANEKGEEEAKEEGGKGEEASTDAKDKAEGAPKKWNVECNGVSFRCPCFRQVFQWS